MSTHNADLVTLREARRKYLRLGREIEKFTSGDAYSDLSHTHSKLGIFLDEALGTQWRDALNDGEVCE